MAQFEDKVLHELDGIKEYDNPMPGWLMAIWWGSLVFAGGLPDVLRPELRRRARWRPSTGRDAVGRRGRSRRYFDANPLVPPSPPSCWPARRTPRCSRSAPRASRARARRVTATQAQGLIGPNLTDDRWIHGGRSSRSSSRRQGLARRRACRRGAARSSPMNSRRWCRTSGASRDRIRPNPRPPEGDPACPNRSRELMWIVRDPADAGARQRGRRSTSRLRRRARGGSALQPVGRREAALHAPVVRKGHYWKIRRAIAWRWWCCFFALPGIPVGGAPAVQIRPVTRQTHVFGSTFSRPTT